MEIHVDLRITVVLLAGLLILVSLLQPLATRLRLPASVLLAIVGISLGTVLTFLARADAGSTLGMLGQVFVDLPVDSNTLLYVFLPALLFQSALSIEVQRMIEDAGPVLLLAIVAVLVATFMIGFALAPFAEVLWGGLRGAVTLALALAVTENQAIDPDVQRFIAVLATGFVLFTLLISGTTLRMLIGICSKAARGFAPVSMRPRWRGRR